jgi:hypothetical protein
MTDIRMKRAMPRLLFARVKLLSNGKGSGGDVRIWPPHHLAYSHLIARSTASGVSGSSVTRTPIASWTALAIAGDTPKVPDSPRPLAPNGPFVCSAATQFNFDGRNIVEAGRQSIRSRQAEHMLGQETQDQIRRNRRHLVEPRFAELAFDVVFLRKSETAVSLDAGLAGGP